MRKFRFSLLALLIFTAIVAFVINFYMPQTLELTEAEAWQYRIVGNGFKCQSIRFSQKRNLFGESKIYGAIHYRNPQESNYLLEDIENPGVFRIIGDRIVADMPEQKSDAISKAMHSKSAIQIAAYIFDVESSSYLGKLCLISKDGEIFYTNDWNRGSIQYSPQSDENIFKDTPTNIRFAWKYNSRGPNRVFTDDAVLSPEMRQAIEYEKSMLNLKPKE